MVCLISVIIPPFIKSSFLGSPSPVYWPFPRFYTPSLRGKLEFLVDIPFKSIIFFCLGSSRAALLGLNNLFLVFLFAGFMHLISYLFINKAVVFQLFYFIIFLMENLWPDYIMFFLYFAALSYNLIFLFNFPFICGPTSLYKLIFKVIWFFNSVFRRFYYIFIYFLSLVSVFVPYFLP